MSLAKGTQLAAFAALSVVTVVLVVLAVTPTVATVSPSTRESARAAAASPTAAQADEPPEVTVIGDDHVLREGSWFYRAVPDESDGPVQQGAVIAEDGAHAIDLADMTDQVLPGDIVLIAAGATDVEAGEEAPTILGDIKSIVRSVRAQDAKPVLVTVPPSDDRGFLTKLVNRKMRAYANARRIPLVDVFDELSDQPGNWVPEYTDDGTYANEAGSQLQAEAAIDAIDVVLSRLS